MNIRFARFAALGAAAALSLGGIAGASAQGDTTIKMIAAQYTPQMQPYFDQLTTAFEAANPGIKVEVEVVSWADNALDQKIEDARPDRPGAGHREPQLLRELRCG